MTRGWPLPRARGRWPALAVLAAALALAAAAHTGWAGIGGGRGITPSGSTLASTWGDPSGSGRLSVQPGEPMVARVALARASPVVRTLATFVQIADAHVTDEESPARVEMLDRLGPPFTSAFRPQEALTTQVLAAVVATVNRARPQAVFETGDLIDNDQQNELDMALAVLRGGRVDPNSGGPGYAGVQAAGNPDPLVYRPDVDAPQFPGLLAAAQRPFTSPGLRAPWFPLPGNHDLLVQGNVRPIPAIQRIATGSRKLLAIDADVLDAARARRLSAGVIRRLLARGLPGRAIRVPPDPRRRELPAAAVLARLRRASGHGGRGPTMDAVAPLGRRAEAILLDTTDRRGGARGRLRAAQVRWLAGRLRDARTRWVIVFSATPLAETRGAAPAMRLLDRDPRVVAAVAGDVHRNSIVPRRTPAGGYWLITTSSLADYPQQARAFRLAETADGGVVLETWMLNADPSSHLAEVSRELAYLDYQGGRARGWAGGPEDRNARLYR